MNEKKIKYLDMFAGIGGFRSGLGNVGDIFLPVGYCEIDPHTRRAYETLYDTKGEICFEDARTIDLDKLPDIDLVCGGFPCQTFSIAGQRRGFEDARGTLFFEIARIARVKKPTFLFLENVPGLLSHDRGRTFAAILSSLDELGYDVAWEVLNSADFGVAQSRKRVFIVGFLRERCAGKVLSFRETNPKTMQRRLPGKQGSRVYSANGLSQTLTSGGGGFAGNTGLYEIELPIKSKTISGYQMAYPGDSIDLAYADQNSRRGRVGHDIAHTVTPSATQGVFCIDMNPPPSLTELARCITARQDSGISKHKGEHSGVFIESGAMAVISPEKENVRQQGRRIKEPDEPMFTITACDRHGVIHNGHVRKLTPREAWRLQGFTDEQFDKVKALGMSDARLYKMAGNAVTVNVITAVGQIIKEVFEEMNEKENEKCQTT